MKLTQKQKYEIAIRALYAVGGHYWYDRCRRALKRIGELKRLDAENDEWYCRMLRRKRKQGTWAMCDKCPRKKYEKCVGSVKPR